MCYRIYQNMSTENAQIEEGTAMWRNQSSIWSFYAFLFAFSAQRTLHYNNKPRRTKNTTTTTSTPIMTTKIREV